MTRIVMGLLVVLLLTGITGATVFAQDRGDGDGVALCTTDCGGGGSRILIAGHCEWWFDLSVMKRRCKCWLTYINQRNGVKTYSIVFSAYPCPPNFG